MKIVILRTGQQISISDEVANIISDKIMEEAKKWQIFEDGTETRIMINLDFVQAIVYNESILK